MQIEFTPCCTAASSQSLYSNYRPPPASEAYGKVMFSVVSACLQRGPATHDVPGQTYPMMHYEGTLFRDPISPLPPSSVHCPCTSLAPRHVLSWSEFCNASWEMTSKVHSSRSRKCISRIIIPNFQERHHLKSRSYWSHGGIRMNLQFFFSQNRKFRRVLPLRQLNRKWSACASFFLEIWHEVDKWSGCHKWDQLVCLTTFSLFAEA